MRRSISGELTCRIGLCEEDRRRPTVSPVCRCVPVMKPPSGRLDPRPLVSVAATASSPPSSVRAAVCLPACLLHTVYTLQPAVQPAVKCQRTFSPLSTQPTNNYGRRCRASLSPHPCYLCCLILICQTVPLSLCPDMSPVPIRSALKSNFTFWCNQNLSKRALNELTLSASTTELALISHEAPSADSTTVA